LDSSLIKIASYLQVPILYVVDVLWFENGLPRLFEILGSSLFFVALILMSIFVPTKICKYALDEIREEECKSLLGSTAADEKIDVTSDCPKRKKGAHPGGGAYGSTSNNSQEIKKTF